VRIHLAVLAVCAALTAGSGVVAQGGSAAGVTWADLGPLQPRLEARGLTADAFPAYVQRLRETHAARVRDGDFDHLVFYLLQSTRFTSLPPLEPASSARDLVDSLPVAGRTSYLAGSALDPSHVPAAVRSRIAALVRALDEPAGDARLRYFGELTRTTFPDTAQRATGIGREYLRAMRFVYLKEFVAQRSATPAEAVADLYRSRGLSTDTAVEAGFLVSTGLGILKSLEPDRQIRRVLIVGPGLDLAPRTALLEEGGPESYQPWAVMDALVAAGLSRLADLSVVGGDINPRVVSHLRRSHDDPPALTLVSGVRADATVSVSPEYREYFDALGRAIAGPGGATLAQATVDGRLRKRVRVSGAAARALSVVPLDIVTERLRGQPFDIVIATNVLPYFDDEELILAISNIASALAPGGVLLHNEARPALDGISRAVGLPFEQSRHAVVAAVRGAGAPLFDSVWLHRKAAGPPR
jgi:SAM-dependent methyltransferase